MKGRRFEGRERRNTHVLDVIEGPHELLYLSQHQRQPVRQLRHDQGLLGSHLLRVRQGPRRAHHAPAGQGGLGRAAPPYQDSEVALQGHP